MNPKSRSVASGSSPSPALDVGFGKQASTGLLGVPTMMISYFGVYELLKLCADVPLWRDHGRSLKQNGPLDQSASIILL